MMGSYDSEDSTGKSRYYENQTKNRALLSTFIVGLCIGVVISERVYVRTNWYAASDSGTVSKQLKTLHGSSKKPRNDLEAVLLKIAPQHEVLVGVSNKNPLLEGMLDTFLEGVQQAKISNYLIVALDEETERALASRGLNVYFLKLQIANSQQGTGDNHAISALKFGILKRFLELGWSVFLSDIDVCVLQNPFDVLYRDSDVEGMTDGFDDHTAYGSIEGFDDPSMGWARYAQFYKHFNLNSGLFYVKANARTVDLMTRLEGRLSKQKYWDQTAFNEEIFFLSHDGYKSPQVTVRVLNIYKFMNTKVLFKDVRHRPKADQPPMPVTVHVNYHPNKFERMKAIFKFYLKSDEHALDTFPDGSE